eukprot:3411155-Pyramimonas_sp.AAC.1
MALKRNSVNCTYGGITREPKMRLILDKVGLDNFRLNMIKEVCDTCRECRTWERPGNSTLPS